MTSTDAFHKALGSLTESRLMAHIGNFATWTKHAGSPGELQSLEYVRHELTTYGYAVNLILHDAYISLPLNASLQCREQLYPAITHSFSRATDPAGIRADLVVVGTGTAQEFDAMDVRGKAVLVDGVASPRVTREASFRGAVAQVHVSPDLYLHEMCVSPVWGSPNDHQLDQLPSTIVVSVNVEARNELRRAALDREQVTLTAEVDTGWRKTPILVAELNAEKSAKDDAFVLFSGHHDTWHYGVMDNGGANSTMLEVARVCAANRRLWRRGLRVVFWSGHSQGRYSSSAWYADHNWEELEARALVHVNIDSTGGLGNIVVANATAAAELAAVASEALEVQAGQTFTGRRMSRAGDQSFWGIGIPSIFANMGEQPPTVGHLEPNLGQPNQRIGPGTGWWWHTPYDTADKIDPKLLLRDTRIYLHAMWTLLISPVLPLDYTAGVASILASLQAIQSRVADHFDLSMQIQRADHLHALLVQYQKGVVTPAIDEQVIADSNELMRRLSRLLVPIDYTLGNRLVHDPALPAGPLPALADVPLMATLDPSDPEFSFISTRLLRSANWIGSALKDAIALVTEALEARTQTVSKEEGREQ